MTDRAVWDTVIVGGGPAGLSAALVLGRARRRVLVLNSGQPRNGMAHALHGVLGHDGRDPAELLLHGRAEVERYGVAIRRFEVDAIEVEGERLAVMAEIGQVSARSVVLATGMRDALPEIDGFDAVWGRSAHICPYCDAWEHRGQAIGVYAHGECGLHMALLLRQWSDDVVLLTDGPHGLSDRQRAGLSAREVVVIEDPVARLESDDGQLRRVCFTGGSRLDRQALFFFVGWEARSALAAALGCDLGVDGSITVDGSQQTSVDGVYAVGNCSDPSALVPIASAAGVTAATAINARLVKDDLERALSVTVADTS